jgi:mannose-1-phosphate guanylyltransferase/mannose-6-phosphate isomerase
MHPVCKGGKVNYAIILSGGSGTRLWPLSRRARPKHLISLTGGPTLLEQTLDRLDGLIPSEQRFLITIPEQAPIVRDLARGRALGIIIEPMGRNNVLPMALSTKMIYARDPDAFMVFLPADHNIEHPDRLRDAVNKALEIAAQGYIVTLGIPISRPEPSYGHLLAGDPVPGFEKGDYPGFVVQRFHEKPPWEKAEKYSKSAGWFWNGGIFIYKAATMLELIEKHQPELAKLLKEQAPSLGMAKPSLANPVIDWAASVAISGVYKDLPVQLRTSIDFALMERAEKVAVVPVDIGWDDLGGFKSLSELLDPDAEGNRVASRQDKGETHVLMTGCENVSVFPAKRTIVCLDCHDLIVVDTADAVLVLPRESSGRVGEVVEQLRQRGWNALL